MRLICFVASITSLVFSLFGDEQPLQFEGTFEGWGAKRLELISLFLPEKPTLLSIGGQSSTDPFLRNWPHENSGDKNPDLLYVDLRGEESFSLQNYKAQFDSARCVYMQTCFSSQTKTRYSEIKKWMASVGFKPLAHWYRRGSEGEAIFVKQDYFYNQSVRAFLEMGNIVNQDYKIYYEPHFEFSYFLEDFTTDSIKNILKQGLPYEGHIGLIIEHLTKRGSIAIDIGAHIGVHTLTMSRKTGPEGAVFAFEPNKKSYAELLQNLLLNRCGNTIPICKALGAEAKQSLLGEHKIEEEAEGKSGEWVETIPLDAFHLQNVSILKMDIENYEYHALLGARETILKNRPILIFECWIGKDYEKSALAERSNFDRVIELLESYGYEIYVIFSNDFIAFPMEGTDERTSYKANFKRLDLNNFDLGL